MENQISRGNQNDGNIAALKNENKDFKDSKDFKGNETFQPSTFNPQLSMSFPSLLSLSFFLF